MCFKSTSPKPHSRSVCRRLALMGGVTVSADESCSLCSARAGDSLQMGRDEPEGVRLFGACAVGIQESGQEDPEGY